MLNTVPPKFTVKVFFIVFFCLFVNSFIVRWIVLHKRVEDWVYRLAM